MWMPAVRLLLGLALYSCAVCNDFLKGFLFSPVALHLREKKKNNQKPKKQKQRQKKYPTSVRIVSSRICILCEFAGTRDTPPFAKTLKCRH